MGRALALVAIVAIIAVVVLLLVWTDRRRTTRRAALARANTGWERSQLALAAVQRQVDLQRSTGVTDIPMIQHALDSYVPVESFPLKKEIRS